MAKCGKGCMPECKYFTTGGCISPFNCPYKIETGYINSATSIPAYMEQYKGMSHDVIKRLKAENAALHERLKEVEHRAEVEERALVIIAERVLEYAQKAKVTAMTSGGLFSYDKDAQLALLVNDAPLKAEQKMARKENNESDF